MNNLVVENGFLTLNGKRYSEMNWFEMKAFDLHLEFQKKMFELKRFEKKNKVCLILKEIILEEIQEKKPLLRVENRG